MIPRLPSNLYYCVILCAEGTVCRWGRVSAGRGWKTVATYPYKQRKVMYLICVVGAGYKQEEPSEGVVGWTWKTGLASFTERKRKKIINQTEPGSTQGKALSLTTPSLCNGHSFGQCCQCTCQKCLCSIIWDSKSCIYPGETVAQWAMDHFLQQGLAWPKDATFVQSKRKTGSLRQSSQQVWDKHSSRI